MDQYGWGKWYVTVGSGRGGGRRGFLGRREGLFFFLLLEFGRRRRGQRGDRKGLGRRRTRRGREQRDDGDDGGRASL